MGTGKTVLVTVLVIAGLLMLALSFVASIVVDTIDQRIADECEDETGTIGEIIGADEGQCQDGRDMRDRVDSIGQMIGYLGAAILVISVIMVAIRKRQ
ncbi:MAG: hypothetical protein OSB22_02325 [Candidatus Poseidoniales archaeon]|jgi:hypothetical protein|nr:hypothetical protein [Candidatus Poseidoniales archaeon]|tara:strand:- start:802 stop:1095 length:294 start_codon:yes stop_codon:yes gene_type:complete